MAESGGEQDTELSRLSQGPEHVYRLVFRERQELKLATLIHDLGSLEVLIGVCLASGVARQQQDAPTLKLSGLVGPPRVALRTGRISTPRVKRISYSSPLELVVSFIEPVGWGAAIVYGMRNLVNLIERWSKMRRNVAQDAYLTAAMNLLRDDLMADIEDPGLRKALRQYMLKDDKIDRAAESLMQIKSVIAISPPEPEA